MGEIGYPKDCTFKKESRDILLAVGEWGKGQREKESTIAGGDENRI
jgi:hypothetical protein